MGAILKMRSENVRNEDGLKLTEELLTNNPDILTLWNYRREILQCLASTEDEEKTQERGKYELKLTELCLRANPKSYGSWHQRCWILENMPKADWSAEVALCDKYLALDERNFHGWDYRRFVVSRAKISPKDEIEFTTNKIYTNFSNYSAWHYRSRLLPHVYPDPLGERPLNEKTHNDELELVSNAVFTDPGDQSAWIYLRWLLGEVKIPLSIERAGLLGDKGIVAFSRAISLTANEADESADCCLQIKTDAGVVQVECEPVASKKYSNLWIFRAKDPKELSSCDSFNVEVSNVLSREQVSSPITLSFQNRDKFFSARIPQFSVRLTEGLREAVMNIYSSVNGLISMEPQSKWAHLTALTTMLNLNKQEILTEILGEIKELLQIDPRRSNYYIDIQSRILMECALESLPENPVKIDLSSKSLSALYHSQYLCLLRDVDLSKNKLGKSLPSLAALQSCEILNLDENELDGLKGFPALHSLRELSLKNNNLADLEDVKKKVKDCESMKTLDVTGNPCISNSLADGKVELN